MSRPTLDDMRAHRLSIPVSDRCVVCQGYGRALRMTHPVLGGHAFEWVACKACAGTGRWGVVL